MSSTYTSFHYHLVFGTKNRLPLILPEWRMQLHSYLGGTVRGLGGFPQGVGGVADHVHLLVGLSSSHRICDFIRELKKASSEWARSVAGCHRFQWQEGYAGFTVSPADRGGVRGYIACQEEHHRVRSFREEILEMLEIAEVTFDPKYLDL